MPGNMSVRCDHDDEDHNNGFHGLVVIIDENESDLPIIVPFSGCPYLKDLFLSRRWRNNPFFCN